MFFSLGSGWRSGSAGFRKNSVVSRQKREARAGLSNRRGGSWRPPRFRLPTVAVCFVLGVVVGGCSTTSEIAWPPCPIPSAAAVEVLEQGGRIPPPIMGLLARYEIHCSAIVAGQGEGGGS